MTSVLDRTVVVIQNILFQIVTMVNSDGFLEEEDTQVSSPRNCGHDTSFPRDDSWDDSDPGGDENDSDGDDDAEEMGPTHASFNISHIEQTRSGANFTGSGEAAQRKRSSTPL